VRRARRALEELAVPHAGIELLGREPVERGHLLARNVQHRPAVAQAEGVERHRAQGAVEWHDREQHVAPEHVDHHVRDRPLEQRAGPCESHVVP
jgi:hypothetical protein